SSAKDLKLEQQAAARQLQVLSDLAVLVKDIERSEKTILALREELAAVNSRYQGPRTTRDDIAYLSALLDCAKKKLAWEKQIGSLQKRTPDILRRMSDLLHDPKAPPTEEMRQRMLAGLQAVQAAMERLQGVKWEEGGAPRN
ncbi:MAG TPA: hypothetical protein VHH88_11345, partial [Verrucomicrobiae bacterium]|nr:hypothetical protein [Verrucomicrobiae bacterium]